MRNPFRTLLLLIILVLGVQSAAAYGQDIKKLEIDSPADTAYTPYRLQIIKEYNYDKKDWRLNQTGQILTPYDSTTGFAEVVMVGLHDHYRNQLVNFDVIRHPGLKLLRPAAVRLKVQAWKIYYDRLKKHKMIFGAGSLRDTAWAFRLDPYTGDREKKFLMTGEDKTGDGQWTPQIRLFLFEDFDYDGRKEAVIYVNRVRDSGFRTLFCLEPETSSLEWSLPIASIPRYHIYSTRDSLNPGIIFAAHGPRQGATDPNFSDLYEYLTIIDNNGELVYNRVIGLSMEGMDFCRSESEDCFYLTHDIDPVSHDSVLILESKGILRSTLSPSFRLSKVSSDGLISASIPLDVEPARIRMIPGFEGNRPIIQMYAKDFRFRHYDTQLKLLGISDPVPSIYFLDTLNTPGVPPALVYSSGLYSTDFDLLAGGRFFKGMTPLTYAEDGTVSTWFASDGSYTGIFKIEKRTLPELLSIFYVKNKIYVLMALSGLLVGLLLTNYYRRRTRRNLALISDQKRELEATHRKLRKAQAKIVAQEKFHQARDIAGGFAHEIRNALSPARNGLTKLLRLDSDQLNPERVDKLGKLSYKAVARAVDITRMISQYTRLEEIKAPEAVNMRAIIDEVGHAYSEILAEKNIRLDISRENIPPVRGNTEQFRIVIENLITNAIDAVADVDNPEIAVRWRREDRGVVIEVSDNGAGMPPQDIDRIFDFFYSTKPDRGTGIGLAMVKKIVEMYDGAISVTSAPGSGSIFTLSLPVFSG